MPWTPIALSASRTSSSLNGLTIAVTIFMALLLLGGLSEALAHRQHERAACNVLVVDRRRPAGEAAVGVDVGRAERPALEVIGDADLPVGDRGAHVAVELGDARAVLQPALVTEMAHQRELLGDRERDGAVEVIGALGVGDPEEVAHRVRILERHRAPAALDVELGVVDLGGAADAAARVVVVEDAAVVAEVTDGALVAAVEIHLEVGAGVQVRVDVGVPVARVETQLVAEVEAALEGRLLD